MSIMNASVSGMQANTNWLSSISQNVANANTTGYKNNEIEFASLVDQTSNAYQDAVGVTTSVRSLNALQGSLTSTSTTTDLAVQGNGYFVVSNASGTTYLTRNGSFVPDAQGNLVNASGYYLMGYELQSGQAPVNSFADLQKVNVQSSAKNATPTTAGALVANLPSTATAVAAANLPSTNTVGSTYTDETSIVGYDNLGAPHTFNVYLSNTGPNTWQMDVFDASTAAAGGGFPYSSGPIVSQPMTFSAANGDLASGSPVSIAVPSGQTLSLDISKMTQLASPFNITSAPINGSAPSTATGVTVGSDGTMSFQFSSGATLSAYNIPLANVSNPDGMTTLNGDVFQATAASGSPIVGTAGSGDLGTMASSALEASTVDLATELTNMIEAQSAYQANSKVFQAGAKVLDVLNSLQT